MLERSHPELREAGTHLLRSVPPALPIDRLFVAGNPASLMRSRVVACVPACNEENWIERCLMALDADLEAADAILLLANGCTDGTIARAVPLMRAFQRPYLLLDCQWQDGSGSAPLARRLALDIATDLAPEAVLLSIDGDTIVLPGLRVAYQDEFDKGYDLVCGRIGFIPEEAAMLPPADAESERVIREYREASREIAALICPDADNPWPHHGNIGGANFAMKGSAYRAVGGLPMPPSGEDRALRRAFEAKGLRIRYANGPRVETSCRLDGRAAGGLSDELRRNRTEPNPIVDELLEPPETLLTRVTSRAAFLGSGASADRLAALSVLALQPAVAEALAARGGEAAWQDAESASPALRRQRLRLDDLRHHLPVLRQALHAIRDARSGSPASPPS